MTPPKLSRFLPVICSPFVAYAGWIAASEPMIWATPSGQPAGQAYAPSLFHVSAKGDHQAQGRGR